MQWSVVAGKLPLRELFMNNSQKANFSSFALSQIPSAELHRLSYT
jgi:hypothetical protein